MQRKCITFKTGWVFLFWDKLCLSELLEDLSGFLILVSCRLDYWSCFWTAKYNLPTGHRSCIVMTCQEKSILRLETWHSRRQKGWSAAVAQEGKKISSDWGKENNGFGNIKDFGLITFKWNMLKYLNGKYWVWLQIFVDQFMQKAKAFSKTFLSTED